MVRGNRSGYVVFGIAVCGVVMVGGCSDGDKTSRPQCGPGEIRTCVQQGVSEQCTCQSGNSGGTGPALDGGGRGGASGSSGSGGSNGSGGFSGTRPIINDGAIGSGGSLGTGGFGGVAGSGAAGSGGLPGTARLGAACTSNVDCGAGLICIVASSSALNGEGPARGLCTASCATDAGLCTRFGLDAVCLNFGSQFIPALYCVEGCTFGPVGSTANPNKCNNRDEVACGPLFGATGSPCTTDANCAAGEICGDGQCFAVLSACLPQCNADSDCGTGRYCNPQTGLCSSSPKTGLPLGEECTQPPAGGADACHGTCIGLVVSSGAPVTTYTCAENCTIGALPTCGWSGPASGTPAPGLCLFSSGIISERGGPGPGDRGSCAQLCNCNADCLHSGFVCIPLGDTSLENATRRRGFCTVPDGNAGIPACPP